MSQQIWSTINPTTTSGQMLAAILTDFKDALMSGLAGTSRPSQLQAGGCWLDISQQAPPVYHWSFKLWTGTVDIEVFRININQGYGGPLTSANSFEVRQISADTVGALQELIKTRIPTLDNGQVLSGDTVAEIRMIGRTITSTDPVVGYMKWVATDDQEGSVFGGTFSVFSTPDASSVIAEHFRFISGQVESVAPIRMLAFKLVAQSVPTATSIVQLSAEKAIVEFTGSTLTNIRGINFNEETRVITLHNRSTAIVVLKDEDAAAAEEDRLSLTDDSDFSIEVDGAITLYYNETEERWKLFSTSKVTLMQTSEEFRGTIWNKWTSGTDTDVVRVTAHKKINDRKFGRFGGDSNSWSMLLTKYGKLYSWGRNVFGVLGLGDVTPRSSPVLVLGGLTFKELASHSEDGGSLSQNHTVATILSGAAYAWGLNNRGQLGVGDVTPRSSPVPVIGGHVFSRVFKTPEASYGLKSDGSLYAWGRQTDGGLGVGDVTVRSSPVPVVGGFLFDSVATNFNGNVAAISKTGALYTWGPNAQGILGLGDLIPRSSPVPVIGGISGSKIKKYFILSDTAYALTKDGDLYGWGSNSFGQLGQNDTVNRSSPVLILGSIENFWAGGVGTVISKSNDGTIRGWGYNFGYNLGIGASGGNTAKSSPTISLALAGLEFEDLKICDDATFGWATDGVIYGWGYDETLALGTNGTYRSSPVVALGGLKVREIAGVTNNPPLFFGALSNGVVYVWGYDTGTGDTGTGTPASSYSSPTLILGPAGVDPSYEYSEVRNIPVSPSTEYELKMGPGACFFGNTPIGFDIERVTLDYTVRGP